MIEVVIRIDPSYLDRLIELLRGLAAMPDEYNREYLIPEVRTPTDEPQPGIANVIGPEEGPVATGWPCKVDGCTELAPTNRSRFARICRTHKKLLQAGGHVIIDHKPHVWDRAAAAGGGRIAPAELGGNFAWCRWCSSERTQRHVEQHDLDVKREHARQEAEREKIKHLAKDPGMGSGGSATGSAAGRVKRRSA